MKRTNVVLDEVLVARARRATGIETVRQLVDYALRELLRRERIKEFRDLRGQVHWTGDLSKMRRGRAPGSR